MVSAVLTNNNKKGERVGTDGQLIVPVVRTSIEFTGQPDDFTGAKKITKISTYK